VHYGVAVIPARVRKATGQGRKSRAGVQLVQRWILARLPTEVFLSPELNRRSASSWCGSTSGLPQATGLPVDRSSRAWNVRPCDATGERFVYAEWKKARVGADYHVEVTVTTTVCRTSW